MSLDSWFTLSKPQFLHLKNGGNNDSYLTGHLEELKLNEHSAGHTASSL